MREITGLTVGTHEIQWRQMQEAHHGAGPKAKRSPKERSAIPGAVTKAPQVALDRLGVVAPPRGPKRRLGSGQQDRGGMGTDPGLPREPGLVVLCLRSGPHQPATTSQN